MRAKQSQESVIRARSFRWLAATAMVLILIGTSPAQTLGSIQNERRNQEETKEPAQQDEPRQQRERQSADDSPELGEPDPGESAALGVFVTATPGQGVFVTSTVWGSPAQQAGIQFGDYIMAIDGKAISSPEELRAAVESEDPGAKVKLKLWRNGEEMEKEVALASMADEVPESHRAWLGVVITPAASEEGGVRVEHVHPGSPADEAGIRVDDVITRAGGKPVENIETLLECLESHGPGSGCELTIQRNGKEESIKVTMGEVENAPQEWTVQAFRIPMELLDFDPNMFSGAEGGMGMGMPGNVQDLQREIEELRRRVEALESNQRRPGDRNERRPDDSEGKDGGDAASSNGLVFSGSVLPASSFAAMMTAPEGGAAAQQQRRYWQGRHYSYRYPYYGNYWYRSGYPYGNNWYYNYGGRSYYSPWYYQQHYWYGPRYGIRIGPGWGVYWY